MTQSAAFYRTRVGDFSVLALHEGTVTRDLPKGFVRNAEDNSVARAFEEAGMAPGKLTLTFTVFAVESAEGLILIDTGFGESGPSTAGRMAANLTAAGHAHRRCNHRPH